jgi:D-alanyl-lipoteichoic acid acyltransferase DltB (MBOAT superfamily)
MVFTSGTFFIFFASFFLLYWFVFDRRLSHQNLFLLFSSYLFYAWWDWRFLSILIAVSLLNFLLGKAIYKTKEFNYKKLLLWIGMLLGIGTLVLFKYYNFFILSFNESFAALELNINLASSHLIIPIGLSYYTFKMISYLLDIYKGKIEPTSDWIVFFSYVSFFPCMLAGPIDKARTFIPQLENKRIFEYNAAADGMRQILWGMFKKVVIADNCAIITNYIFGNYQHLPSGTLLAGAFFYTFQMYADFSGYSDMAIGFSRLAGFNVTKNFNFPFYSENIAEFWRKWHISLTAWLTEYVFTPLSIAFRDIGKAGLILAIVINFTIVGIWHGANWTYVLFGFLHGLYFIPLIVRGNLNKRKKLYSKTVMGYFSTFMKRMMTFVLVMLTFIVFRSENIQTAMKYYRRLFSGSLFENTGFQNSEVNVNTIIFFIVVMLLTEWFQRGKEHGLAIHNLTPIYRWVIYVIIIFIIGMFMQTDESPFIYLQF